VSCPGCSARLRPWGSARSRSIRYGVERGGPVRVHRPRRGRCTGCRVTHVLLPVLLAARRADAGEVIAAAVEAKVVEGWGHRKIAALVGRPVSTVRGWLRAFAACAERIVERFTALVLRDAPDAVAVWPAPAGSMQAAALAVLLAYAAGLGRRFGTIGGVTWVRSGIAACHGRLFCPGFWDVMVQHEPALPVGAPRR
jgi:hypothetical protein